MVPARSLFGVESGAVTMVLAAMGESPRGVHGAHGLGKPSATDSQRYRSFARTLAGAPSGCGRLQRL